MVQPPSNGRSSPAVIEIAFGYGVASQRSLCLEQHYSRAAREKRLWRDTEQKVNEPGGPGKLINNASCLRVIADALSAANVRGVEAVRGAARMRVVARESRGAGVGGRMPRRQPVRCNGF